ncbi:MAG: hypothetical protein IPL78_34305, partial [Chloroflexi bacterium]|nr:hypothetical protein [Chloroflexota bacterium]
QIREMGRYAIMTMAEEQLKFEARLTVHDQRLDKAAYAFADLTKRVSSIEQKLTPGNVITEEQASQLSQAVKAIALELSKKSGRPEFGAVYGELYRRYGITGYKFLPANQFTTLSTGSTIGFKNLQICLVDRSDSIWLHLVPGF